MKSTYRKPLGFEKPCWDSWKAPEHYRDTSDMKRDFRRYDEDGKANTNRLNLVLDKRPTVLKPASKTYIDA